MGSELVMPDRSGELLAAFSFSPSIAIQTSVLIADVSYYQLEIDWQKMASQLAGAIIRAGQRTWPDIRFRENWTRAKAAGVPRGSYWFYDSREDPKRQAALWWQQLQGDIGELVHVADFEESYGGPYWQPSHFKEFIQEFQRLSGLPDDRIAIYTGYYWWLSRVGPDLFFKKYKLWLAWYAQMSVVRVPAPWGEADLLFWQWTSSGNGQLYGVGSLEIDLNWYCCDLVDFRTRFNLGGTPPPPGGPMPIYEATAIGDNTRLRNDHSTNQAYIGNYDRGTRFHGNSVWVNPADIFAADGISLLQSKGDTWLQVVDVNGVAKPGWVAIIHRGFSICTINPPVPPQEPPVSTFPDLPYSVTLGDDITYEKATLTGVLKPKQ